MESEKDAGAGPAGRAVPAILMYHSISSVCGRPVRHNGAPGAVRSADALAAPGRPQGDFRAAASRCPSPWRRARPRRPLLRRRVRGFHRICPAGAAAPTGSAPRCSCLPGCSAPTTPGIPRDRASRCSRPPSCVRWRRPESRSARMAFATCRCPPVPMRTWPGKSGRAGTSSGRLPGKRWMASAIRTVISTNASSMASSGPATPTAARSGIPSSPGGTHSRVSTSGTRIRRGPCGPGEPGAG